MVFSIIIVVLLVVILVALIIGGIYLFMFVARLKAIFKTVEEGKKIIDGARKRLIDKNKTEGLKLRHLGFLIPLIAKIFLRKR